jgi:hypothetical protein
MFESIFSAQGVRIHRSMPLLSEREEFLRYVQNRGTGRGARGSRTLRKGEGDRDEGTETPASVGIVTPCVFDGEVKFFGWGRNMCFSHMEISEGGVERQLGVLFSRRTNFVLWIPPEKSQNIFGEGAPYALLT